MRTPAIGPVTRSSSAPGSECKWLFSAVKITSAIGTHGNVDQENSRIVVSGRPTQNLISDDWSIRVDHLLRSVASEDVATSRRQRRLSYKTEISKAVQ